MTEAVKLEQITVILVDLPFKDGLCKMGYATEHLLYQYPLKSIDITKPLMCMSAYPDVSTNKIDTRCS